MGIHEILHFLVVKPSSRPLQSLSKTSPGWVLTGFDWFWLAANVNEVRTRCERGLNIQGTVRLRGHEFHIPSLRITTSRLVDIYRWPEKFGHVTTSGTCIFSCAMGRLEWDVRHEEAAPGHPCELCAEKQSRIVIWVQYHCPSTRLYKPSNKDKCSQNPAKWMFLWF